MLLINTLYYRLNSTPGSARKVIMGIEKGLNRVRGVLTPKRRLKTDGEPDKPVVLSGKVINENEVACRIFYL